MNLNHLHYFQTLARCEHFTKAAQELHIAQPSLSKAIAGLEQELGVYLFEKNGRNMELTKLGKRYLEFVEPALLKLEEGYRYLQKERMMTEGYIDLGFVSSIEYTQIPQWIKGFSASHHKNVYFSCKSGTSKELVKGLKEDKFDLIFCTKLPEERMVEFVPVFEQKLVFVLSKGHPFWERDSVSVKELEGERMISHTKESAMWDVTRQLYEEAGIQVNIVSEAEEDRTIMGLVKAEIGNAVMTDSPGIHEPELRVIPITGSSYRRYICMGYRKDRARPKLVELFRRYVMEHHFCD